MCHQFWYSEEWLCKTVFCLVSGERNLVNYCLAVSRVPLWKGESSNCDRTTNTTYIRCPFSSANLNKPIEQIDTLFISRTPVQKQLQSNSRRANVEPSVNFNQFSLNSSFLNTRNKANVADTPLIAPVKAAHNSLLPSRYPARHKRELQHRALVNSQPGRCRHLHGFLPGRVQHKHGGLQHLLRLRLWLSSCHLSAG